jgi:hypothetical protein
MATFSKVGLSGSTNGLGIKISATSTPGTLIHVCPDNETDWDEIWLYCVNSSTSDVKLTLEFGTHAVPDGNIEKTIPAESGLYCIIPGLVLQHALEINAFAGTTDVLIIYGFVNRIIA